MAANQEYIIDSEEWREYQELRRREAQRRRNPRRRVDIPALLVLLLFTAACGYVLYSRYFGATPLIAITPHSAATAPAMQPAPVAPVSVPVPAVQPAPVVQVVPTAVPAVAPTICAPPLCRVGDGGGGAGQGWGDAPAVDVAPPVEVAAPAPIPTTSAEQQAVLAGRTSNGCAAGEIFVPRVGCHTPGSGGAMPGPVGAK